jgi:hypothetical protein
MIAGLIITGSGTKRVLLRALGPTLARSAAPVGDVLPDPVLELHSPNGTTTTNESWREGANAELIPEDLQPRDATEAALLVSLAPGAYTAIVRGAGGGTGNALIDAFDLDANPTASLSNVATRSFVQRGDKVMIAGFTLEGTTTKDVFIRALGPSIAQPPTSVPNVLADPLLTLFNANGDAINTNDNWQDTQGSRIQATGLAPSAPQDAAMIVTLSAGAYTAIVSGVSDGTGNATVEVYALQ